ESHVPHEVMHCVLATHFAKPLPRWADEGIAVAAEGAGEQINHDVRCRELLNAGRGIRLKTLFRMRDYPRDLMTLYAQGHSVIRFLLASPVKPGPEGAVEKDGKIIRTFRSVPYAESVINGQPVQFSAFFDPGKPQQVLLAFIEIGMYKNTAESWDRAAREVYGFDSVDALEESWVEWLKDPKSRLKSKPEPVTPAKPAAKSADPELIPPTKLPGVDPDR
ncbi:MAG TPA: hypothetical protein VKE74_27815, partial [Gemmataceae bacterium]|nr:hypothetical protein [Gemmataceae bacterium]